MSLKNKKAKPAKEIKKETELTIEQHISNVQWALQHGSLTISNAERNTVYASFNEVVKKLTEIKS